MKRVIVRRPSAFKPAFIKTIDETVDEMLNNAFPEWEKTFGIKFEGKAYPKVNVYDYEERVKIIAEIPGLTKDDVRIEVEEDTLFIIGDKVDLFSNEDESKLIKRELTHSKFSRGFQLDGQFEIGKITASFNDGILHIELPKVTPDKPQKKVVDIK